MPLVSEKKTEIPTIPKKIEETLVEKKLETIKEVTIDKKTTITEIIPTKDSSFSYIRLLEEIKKAKATLVLDLKTARFELNGTILTLIFAKEWHYNRTNNPSMKNIISECL
jgi:hypothetical protein